MDAEDWKTSFAALRETWIGIAGREAPDRSVASWITAFDQLVAEATQLKRQGLWASEYADLLHVLRLSNDELTHSSVIAWLLTPTAGHGFGGDLLRDIVRDVWGIQIPNPDSVIVSREVTRDDESGKRRADIIVDAGWVTLVVENKVWAKESRRQCEDLYRLWSARRPGAEVLFLLLSPHGRIPESTESAEARNAWRSLSYRWLGNWLRRRVTDAPPSLARSTTAQYLAAIRPLMKLGSPRT